MQQDNKKKNVKVYYIDIDGVFAIPLSYLSVTEQKEKLEYMQEVFREFKFDFPSTEELIEAWREHNTYINFELPASFSREMVQFILELNGLSLNAIAEDINRYNIGLPVEWHYTTKKVGERYYYQLKLLNPDKKTYCFYDVKHNVEKEIPKYYQTEVLNPESVEAFNLILDSERPEVIVITSSWSRKMNYTVDMLKYQGVHLDDTKIERLNYTNTDRGLSIIDDILQRNVVDSYRVFDDDITASYVTFGRNLIAVPDHRGLQLNTIKKVLGIEKEKEKVLKNGN